MHSTASGARRALAMWLLAALLGLNAWEPTRAGGGPEHYFLSSSQGDDAAPGTSPDRPWRTLERASRQRYNPGDTLSLKAGDDFAGQLALSSSGSAEAPLRIGRYGAGPKPGIDAGSRTGMGAVAAILLRNVHHVEIADLELTNTLDRPASGFPVDWAFGILAINDQGGVLEHLRFERLTIHDIFAPVISHRNEDEFNKIVVSGIRVMTIANRAGRPPSFFRDVVVADNDIARTGRFGVLIGHQGGRGEGRSAHVRDPETGFNRDVIVRGNRFADLGGSAVQVSGGRMVLIEDNDFLRSGSSLVPDRMVGRGSGAWVVNCRDVVAQRNRSRHVRGYKDSYGMHVDFGNRDVIYQYNLSEDSEGGFVEILGDNRNVTWRYNISINDGLREKDGNTIWLSPWSPGQVRSQGIWIYNNTVFVRPGLYPDLDFRAADAHVLDNLFYAARHAMIGETLREEWTGEGLDLAGNLWLGRVNTQFRALDRQPAKGLPHLAMPGAVDPAGYRIAPESAAASGGVAIAYPPFPEAGQGIFANISAEPRVDFFGTRLSRSGPSGIGAAVPALPVEAAQ